MPETNSQPVYTNLSIGQHSIVVGRKRCRRCGEDKPLDQFGRDRNRRDGRYVYCKACQSAYHRRWWYEQGGREKHKATHDAHHLEHRRTELKRLYGLSPQDYDALVEKQGGLCAACGQPETTSKRGRPPKLSVDHDHQTGAVRGLLCNRCNQALGLLGDDPARVEGLLRYIQETSTEGAA